MNKVLFGDCRDSMRRLIADGVKVQTCVTSPPYWGLRDYGAAGQLGLEPTIEEYLGHMVEVFRLVHDLLADDGTLWLNIGDSYANNGKWGGETGGKQAYLDDNNRKRVGREKRITGLKPKDLCMIPARLALALQQPYRDWQIKTEAMRAWVGGIIDGEGCITILETKSSHSESLSYPPIIQVRMCDLEPLDRLVQVVGSSYGKPQHPPSQVAANQRPSWQWKVVSEQAANVIAEIYPFLTCKRKQAIVAWNHQAFRSARGNQARTHGDIEKEQFCKTLINSLNQRESVDIPSWMKEPEITYQPGWYLRQDLIWAKPNPMPESVTDRCTKSHEYLFLLSKSERYYFDAKAIQEESVTGDPRRPYGSKGAWDMDGRPEEQKHGGEPRSWKGSEFQTGKTAEHQLGRSQKVRSPAGWKTGPGSHGSIHDQGREQEVSYAEIDASKRNKRSVWTVSTQPYSEAHFATFPPALIEPCILAGSRPGDIVLDPFFGSGTTGQVAQALGRQWIGCEIQTEYESLQRRRTAQTGMVFT